MLSFGYFIIGYGSLPIAFKSINCGVARFRVFGRTIFNSLSPVFITGKSEVTFHECFHLTFTQPELEFDGIKWCPVFPSHFNDAVYIGYC